MELQYGTFLIHSNGLAHRDTLILIARLHQLTLSHYNQVTATVVIVDTAARDAVVSQVNVNISLESSAIPFFHQYMRKSPRSSTVITVKANSAKYDPIRSAQPPYVSPYLTPPA